MTTRITVSLPDELVAAAKRAVDDGMVPSVSAFVADAMAARLSKRPLQEILHEWDRLYGAPTADDQAWAARELARANAEITSRRGV